MTEKEFLEEYENKLFKIVSENINIIKNNKSLHYNTLFEKYVELNSSISYLGNILISDIMEEYNLDYNYKVPDGFNLVPISSILLRKSFSIQLNILKKFDKETSIFLKEALCRDFPQKC